MDKGLMKQALIAISLLMFFPLIVWYYSILDDMALWLYAWVIPFCFVIFSKWGDLFTKGLIVIAYSVIICAIGNEVLVSNDPNLKDAVLNISLMITLVAGGLGGNLMSHELIKRHHSK